MVELKQVIETFLNGEIDVSELDGVRKDFYSSDSNVNPLYKEITEREKSVSGKKGKSQQETMLALGFLYWLINQPEKALKALQETPPSPQKSYLEVLSLWEVDKVSEVLEAIASLPKNLKDEDSIKLIELDAFIRLADLTKAKEVLKSIKNKKDKPDVKFFSAFLDELNGHYEKAVDEYTKIIESNPDHVRTLFRLGYNYDLRGEDELAIDYYTRCIKISPVHSNALINLGILYEDKGKNERAYKYYAKVVEAHPDNVRARLFLKDARAALNMYYDEEFEKKEDKRNRVLELPVSDFELSVRSRNCLEKMNIKTLGDLTKVTESELLKFKNFGETSLNEIKKMLTSQGLRLGQAVEDEAQPVEEPDVEEEETKEADKGILEKSIDELELSVRARRCLELLKINTIGELVNKTETSLLKTKNFGQTSLNEIKDVLTEFNLELRKE